MDSILTDNEQLYYAKQNNNIRPKQSTNTTAAGRFLKQRTEFTQTRIRNMKASTLHFCFYPFESLETVLCSTQTIHQPAA